MFEATVPSQEYWRKAFPVLFDFEVRWESQGIGEGSPRAIASEVRESGLVMKTEFERKNMAKVSGRDHCAHFAVLQSLVGMEVTRKHQWYESAYLWTPSRICGPPSWTVRPLRHRLST